MSALYVSSAAAVGKARSSNFTLSEKLDLLRLAQPHIRLLEDHTNKHAVIVEKNRCWDSIAQRYNGMGGERPTRTPQGLRTLYKRLKEAAKQEVMLRSHAQPEYRGSISEPTKRVMEMIPHLFHALDRLQYKRDSPVEQPGSSSSGPALSEFSGGTVAVRVDSEDVKPPPDLPVTSNHVTPGILHLRPRAQDEREEEEEEEEVALEEEAELHTYDPSLSPSPSSIHLPLSPTETHRRQGMYLRGVASHRFPGLEAESLQMMREEHELVLANHRKVGLYLDEKREGLKRRQQLEEELLRAKVKVERLRAARLRHGLPSTHI
ncbi:fibrinogen silencer-binding protein [Denticeps clupeoides]|uniref:fibrinogen silencer-binding protein n=1 Tax=Denticeps clupeoides TaxID=299321 RepID=UPI0010A56B9D|nr:fibrinogen silencer-binding protein [Denticeps clupeoides]